MLKRISLTLTTIQLIVGLSLITACSSTPKETGEKKEQEVKKQYECPMKCGGQKYDTAGKCAECGMDLQEVNPS